MKASELREMILDELKSQDRELSKEVFNIRFQRAMGRLENTAKISQLKKDVARVKTLIKEKGVKKV